MNSKKPIREVLLWIFLLGAEALALWRIDVDFGHGSGFFMDTMPFVLCAGALVPLLVVVFRYLPQGKALRGVASLVSIVLAVGIGIGTLFAFYDHHDILAYYRRIQGKSAWKRMQADAMKDDEALRALYDEAMEGRLEEDSVAYGDRLVFYCLDLPGEDGASEGDSSLESAIRYLTYYHVDPDYLARTLDEADTAIFIYPETKVVGYYNPAGLPAIGTGTPAYAVEVMMFPVDLATRTKGPTMRIDRRKPDKQIIQSGREHENYAFYSWNTGVDRVIEEKPEMYRN